MGFCLYSLRIHVRRGLVQHQNLVVSDYGSGEADQLPLADAVVGATVHDSVLQSVDGVGWILELHFVDRPVEHLVRVLLKRVQVVAECSGEQHRILWDNGYP